MNTRRQKVDSSLAVATAAKATPKGSEDISKNPTSSSVSQSLEEQRRIVEDYLPSSRDHPRISIFGSVDFYNPDSPALCDEIGVFLGKTCPRACILTGANAAAHERISGAFLREVGLSAKVFHLAPEGYECQFDFGTHVKAGRDYYERRYILATLADVCISIEGGPGTSDEMRIAVNASKILIPLFRSGGASGGMFDAPTVARPPFVNQASWDLLQDERASVEDSPGALVSIARAALEYRTERRKKRTTLTQKEAMEKAIVGALDITYTKRPQVAEDSPAYVEPTLAGCAHRVFCGQEHTGGGCGDIYLGPEGAANCWEALEAAKIGGIVNCTPRVPNRFQGRIQYCTVAVNDECGADILAFLDGASEFLALVENGINILVHCQMGISRSSTVVIAYLIRFWKMTRDEAYLHVKARRPKASPNPGFWDQLKEFEERWRERPTCSVTVEAEALDFDMSWAKASNAFYATCRESPSLLLNHNLTQRLSQVEDERTREQVLTVCLDYIWGRGVLEIDLDWIVYVCETVDIKDSQQCSSRTVEEILQNENSDFRSIWAGEVYDSQIQKVLKKLKLL